MGGTAKVTRRAFPNRKAAKLAALKKGVRNMTLGAKLASAGLTRAKDNDRQAREELKAAKARLTEFLRG